MSSEIDVVFSSIHLLFQFRQQIQCFKRGQAIQIYFAQLFKTGCDSGVKIVNCAAGRGREWSLASCSVTRCSAFSCSASTSRARSITSFGNPASFATSIP